MDRMSMIAGLERPLPPLPDVRTSLLGRASESADLYDLVTQPDARLVTITGPGGIGKTRLALHVAAEVRDRGERAVAFIPLASIREPDLVLLAIGQTVGLVSDPQETYEDHLIDFLKDVRATLVLDNLEQVLGVVPAIDRILRASPGITILATSQIALRIDGERVFSLSPLSIPSGTGVSIDEMLESGAVELFIERARAITPDLALDEGTTTTIAAICRKLDGLPLAIELAAARVNVMSPESLLTRLDDQMRALGEHRGDVPERLRTIRAAVSWSYQLLDPVGQAFFRRLSVFSGGFAADGAAAMFEPLDDRSAEDVLGALVAHSLVKPVASASGERRYLMLESLRSYGLEQLALLEEEPEARLAHATWVTHLAEEAETGLQGSEQHGWLKRLDTEWENVRSAVAWSLEHGHGELVLRIAGSCWHYFPARGLVTDGRAWLSQALASRSPAAVPYRAKALNAAGHLAHEYRDMDAANAYFEQARHLAVASGDTEQEIGALYGLGHVAHGTTEFARAFDLHQEGIRLAREIGNQRLIVVGDSNLGLASFFQGKMEDAVRYWNAAAKVLAVIGDVSGEALMLSNIGSATIRMGDLPSARDYTLRALELQRTLGTRARLLSTLNNLGIIHIQLKEFDRAAEVFAEAMAMHREDGNIAGQSQIAHSMSNLELDQENVSGAAAWFLESVRLFAESDDVSSIFDYISLLVAICAANGNHAEAVELLAADGRLREEVDFETSPEDAEERDDAMETARKGLEGAAFAAAWESGCALNLHALQTRMPIIARQIVGRQYQLPEEPVTVAAVVTEPVDDPYRLTDREREVLRLVAAGRTTGEIAAALHISPRTTAKHVSNIMEKMDVSSRTSAVALAMREGLI
jgi:predicted ATPase/DNA-binding NarL/FixJ family response regulator/Tfp pilus assembly protein PilF